MKQAYLGLLAIVFASAVNAAPGDVNANAFYSDAVALQKKGMGAIFDKRLKPMMAQMKDAGIRTRALNEAAAKSGKPLYCVPEAKRKKGMGAQRVMELLGSIPESERRSMTLAEAWKRVVVREYPCT